MKKLLVLVPFTFFLIGCGLDPRAAYVDAAAEFGCAMFNPNEIVDTDKELEEKMVEIFKKHGFVIESDADFKAIEDEFGQLPGVANEIKGKLENCYSSFDLESIVE